MAYTTVATYSGRSIIWNRMKGAGAEAKNIAWGIGTPTAAAATDVNLFAPSSEARTPGTSSIITTASLGDTYQVTGTIVASAARAITEAALFDTTVASLTTTVSNSLAAGTTTLTLGTTLAGAAGNFYAQIGNEVVLVTGAAATSVVVTRGQFGTSAGAYAIGTPITMGGDGGGVGTTVTTVNQASMTASYGGNVFIHSSFAAINLNSNDSVSFTFSDTLT